MEEGNLVEEYMLGNTKIQIYDGAYINRSKEDIQRTIKNIEAIGKRILLRNMQEGGLKQRWMNKAWKNLIIL